MCKYCEYKSNWQLLTKEESSKYDTYSDEELKILNLKRIDGKIFKRVYPNYIHLLLTEKDIDCPSSVYMDIYPTKDGRLYYKGGYHHYTSADRYYNSWDDDLSNGTPSPTFRSRSTKFKFCPICGRKLVSK